MLGSLACDASDCVTASISPDASDEGLTFDAIAGQEYVVVVDGWEDAVSDFHLEVACDGGSDTQPQDSDIPADSEADDSTAGPWSPGDRERFDEGPLDCGCGAVPRPGWGAWVLGLLGMALRRRRRGW